MKHTFKILHLQIDLLTHRSMQVQCSWNDHTRYEHSTSYTSKVTGREMFAGRRDSQTDGRVERRTDKYL